MTAIARKRLISWEEVHWFYNSPLLNALPEEKEAALRAVASASVFWAWWNARLDSEDTPDEMIKLSEMRMENDHFDEDLHEWCERNECEVRNKWAEKKAAKLSGGDKADDGSTGGGGAGLGAGWGQASALTTREGGDGDDTAPSELVSNGGRDESAPPLSNNENGATYIWETITSASEEPRNPPNSIASPEIGDHDITSENGTANGTALAPLSGLDQNVARGVDWAEEVNEEVVNQRHRYKNDQR